MKENIINTIYKYYYDCYNALRNYPRFPKVEKPWRISSKCHEKKIVCTYSWDLKVTLVQTNEMRLPSFV